MAFLVCPAKLANPIGVFLRTSPSSQGRETNLLSWFSGNRNFGNEVIAELMEENARALTARKTTPNPASLRFDTPLRVVRIRFRVWPQCEKPTVARRGAQHPFALESSIYRYATPKIESLSIPRQPFNMVKTSSEIETAF